MRADLKTDSWKHSAIFIFFTLKHSLQPLTTTSRTHDPLLLVRREGGRETFLVFPTGIFWNILSAQDLKQNLFVKTF